MIASRLLLIGVASVACSATLADGAETTQSVSELIQTQIADWNRGDVEAYMRGYRRSDDLRFATDGYVKRGFDEVLARYRNDYADRASMGQLSVSDLEITELGADAAIAFGGWAVKTADSTYCGLFTLTLRRFDEGWRITQEHTSTGQGCADD